MTDDQHAEGASGSGGRWDPLPQGDYDDGATAFVKLPEGGIEALLAADSPLAAPGHGYVPPQITAASAAPEAAGPPPADGWADHPAAPTGGAHWPEPAAAPREGGEGADPGPDDRFAYRPGHSGVTQQWHVQDAPPAHPEAPGRPQRRQDGPAPGHDVTGQWSIPVAGGDLPDESGEFTTSSLIQQWGGTPPATLPGGASAPWAAEPADEPWGRPEQHDPAAGGYGAPAPYEREHDGAYGHEYGYGHEHVHEDGPGPRDRHEDDRDRAPDGEDAPGRGHAPGEDAEHTASGAGRAAEGAEVPVEPAEEAAEPAAGPAPDEDAAARSQAADEAVAPLAPADGEAAAAERPDARAAGSSGAAQASPGAGAEAAREETAPQDPPPAAPQDEHPLASYVLRVNGVDRPVTDAWIGESLLYVLRERLGLAGAKDGCSQGECGACNVQVDGRLVASCLAPAVTAAGSEVRTVEGLAADGRPSDVQRALARCGAVQCGFCVPGMAMTVHDLLEGNPAPTELETRQALCGNLCRCSGYRGVLRAVDEVVAERAAHAAAEHAAAEHAAAEHAAADHSAAAEHSAAQEPGPDAGGEPRIPHQAGPGAGGVHPSAFDAPEQHAPHAPHDAYDQRDGYAPHDAYDPQDSHDPYGQDGGQA
ncbi:2Fe-2S iron-sulfur cluster-binding protein [Streptomyces sp. NPDC046985]|uniref:2Fe-2S iron-sulfur cluster-binding protein n=1 Tax=Streptomyces sp. NPDC046985 TaxID=3155377 RepID=UPI00340A1A12